MIGQKVVLFDRIGVWLKIDGNKAKCIYGPDNDKEMEIPPHAFVYAIYDHPKFRPQPRDNVPVPAELPASPELPTSFELPTPRPWKDAAADLKKCAVEDLDGATKTEFIKSGIAEPLPTSATGSGITVVLIDEDNDKKILEIPNADYLLLAALAEGIIVGDMRYQMRESVLDYTKKILYVSVESGSKLELR
jgi:hypothetical protein